MEKFGLELAEEKTRILEFGRFAKENRKKRREGKPETFNFLGFTFYCTVSRKAYFCVKLKSDRKRVGSKLKKLKAWIIENRHRMKPDELIKKLNRSLVGYYNYYAVSDNMPNVRRFRYETIKLLFKWLNRRSQRKSFTWDEFNEFITRVPIVIPRLKFSLY
jgi:hypothetical protein